MLILGWTVAEIASSVSAVSAISALIMSTRNGRKIQQVHVSINSRMDQLLVEKGISSKATGVAQGRDEVTAEHKALEPVQVEVVNKPEQPIPVFPQASKK